MNLASAIASSSTLERLQGIKQLQLALKENLAQFLHYTVGVRLCSTYWFSNEYQERENQQALKLANSYARLRTLKPLSDYSIAIITGEGGLFQGLPELAACCDLILQVDCDPKPLEFSALLLEECKKAEHYTDKDQVVTQAIAKFQKANPELKAKHTSNIFKEFQKYTTHMERNLFSSAERFAEFKRCLDLPVQQVCLNYFSKEAITTLSETLRNHGAKVRFLNISNVTEYPENFYKMTPYDGTIADKTPSLHLRELPFSDDAICAYSMLYGFELFTAAATITEMPDALHSCALNRRDWDLRKLCQIKRDTLLFQQLCGTLGAVDPAYQLTTRIFLFFAKYPILAGHDWILRLTAARLTTTEVQELQAQKQEIKSIYFENHRLSTKKSLFLKILDKITTEAAPPEASATKN